MEEEYEETYVDEEEEEQEVYQNNDYDKPKKRINLSETKRKILTFSIIIIVSFSLGCAIVGFSMLSSENSVRKDLANTDLYLATIIDSFSVTAYNVTDEDFYTYSYERNSTNTFETEIGEVVYVDEQANLEYMEISVAPTAPEMTIQKITFFINEKSQLNIIIFADGNEVYNAMKIKNNIALVFLLFVTEISVYVF
jgi:hypothetical protein